MEEITYDYYEEENQFGETDTDSKEYENINGYYINISYLNNILSIIVYNLQLLDEKKYGLEIELNDLLKKHNIFKNYRTMKKIFNFLNDLIAEKHFNIKQEGDIIKFCFIPDINQNDNIDFEISLEKKQASDVNKNIFYEIIHRYVSVPFDDDSNLEDLIADSIVFVQLLVDVEEAFSFEFDAEALVENNYVHVIDLYNHIKNRITH